MEAFEKKAQCFIDQHEAFSVPDTDGKLVHINGRLTLGENIADAGGLNAAFAAWKKHEAQYPSQLLPGLHNFSKEQLFFMSYGSGWCSKTRANALITRIHSNPHAPNFARLLVSNLYLDYFSITAIYSIIRRARQRTLGIQRGI